MRNLKLGVSRSLSRVMYVVNGYQHRLQPAPNQGPQLPSLWAEFSWRPGLLTLPQLCWLPRHLHALLDARARLSITGSFQMWLFSSWNPYQALVTHHRLLLRLSLYLNLDSLPRFYFRYLPTLTLCLPTALSWPYLALLLPPLQGEEGWEFPFLYDSYNLYCCRLHPVF